MAEDGLGVLTSRLMQLREYISAFGMDGIGDLLPGRDVLIIA